VIGGEGVELPKARFYKSDDEIYSFELPEAHIAVVPNPKEILPSEDELLLARNQPLARASAHTSAICLGVSRAENS
jgi:hypothetical protein